MKAAVLVDDKKIVIKDLPRPEPGPDEILMKVSVSGICGSDHSLFNGKFNVPYPVIAGHEAVGTIAQLGKNVTDHHIGERITVQPNFSCGVCPLCLNGQKNICLKKVRLGIDTNGVFAEYVRLPANSIFTIPDGLENDVAVYAEPLSVAVHASNMIKPNKGKRILIFGSGIVGLLILQLEKLKGAKITTCDLQETHLMLSKKLGAVDTIGPKSAIEPYQNQFDVIYETSGAPDALARAIDFAAPGGKIVVLGLPPQTHPLSANMIVRKELHIMGSIIYVNEFPESLNHLKLGHIQTDLLTTGKFALEQLNSALMDFSNPDRVKLLVSIHD
jgi:L-iditol 2-dehydrogenase